MINPEPVNSLKVPLWTKNFVLITIINLLVFLSFQMFPSAMPPYLKSLGAPDSVLGWVAGISTLSALIFRPISGILLDKLGRRGIFLFGLIIMIVSTAAYHFFPIVAVILAIRFIHGIGWSVGSTASSTIASDNIPRPRFGEGMGFYSLSASVAIAISPFIALTIGMQATVFSATWLLIIATGLALFIRYDSVPVQPSATKEKAALFEKSAIMPAIVMLLLTATYGALVTFIAIFAEEQGIGNIGSFFTAYAIAVIFTRPWCGRLIDRFGNNIIVFPAMVLLVIALLCLSQASSLLWFLISAVLYGISYGALLNSLQAMAIRNAPRHRVGAANATFFTGFDLGIGLGAVVSGLIVTAVGYSHMYLSLTLLPIAAGIAYGIHVYREKRDKA